MDGEGFEDLTKDLELMDGQQAHDEKHLAKEHNIGHGKGKTLPTPNDIGTVRVQSFCTGTRYRPFVVCAEEKVEREETQTVSSPSSASDSADLAPHAALSLVADQSSCEDCSSHAVKKAHDSATMKLAREFERI